MDKLKQVQKYQFWILLGVALILPLVGWSIARSGFIGEVEERSKTLKGLNDQLVTSNNDPNAEWKKGIDVINVEQSKQKEIAWRTLWERQVPLMIWPPKMPGDPAKIQPVHQEYWRTTYRTLVTALRQKYNPYDEDNPTGLFIYDESQLPAPDVNEWISAPSVPQIEASLEDLWLLDSLLKAITSVNEGASSIFEAQIRQIEALYLRGGSPKGGGGAVKSSNSNSSTGGMDMAGMKDKNMMSFKGAGGMDFGGNTGGGGSGGVSITPAAINADEDLGAERAAAGEKKAVGANDKAGGLKSPGGLMAGGGELAGRIGGGSGTTKGSWSGFDKDRYRDDKPEWRTRGFHLEVIMDHRKVPELLVALANADWPTSVLRIQMSDYKDEDLVDAAGEMAGQGGPRGGSASSMRSMPPGGSGPPGAAGAAMPGVSSRTGNPAARSPGRTGRDDDESDPSGGAGSRRISGSAGAAGNRSPLDDPNLAHVAIVGVIYLIKKPPEEKAGPPGANPAPPTGTTPGAPSVTSPVGNPAGAPAAAAPAEKAAAETSTAPADANPAAAAGEDEKTTETPAAPAGEKPAEPAKNEPASEAPPPGPDKK
ncbi:MAG: hypothetical protein HY290_22145 [Planctomycetia bacterium]|nr:hypothetical protein [Planctomycetia bacterium]